MGGAAPALRGEGDVGRGVAWPRTVVVVQGPLAAAD